MLDYVFLNALAEIEGNGNFSSLASPGYLIHRLLSRKIRQQFPLGWGSAEDAA